MKKAVATIITAGALSAGCATPAPGPTPTHVPIAPTSTVLTLTVVPAASAVDTTSPTPLGTTTAVSTDTPPVPSPTPTATPRVYVTLGPPYPTDCGDGIPLISSNDSFNGLFLPDRIDQLHGHVDIIPPTGCDVSNMTGEVIAPVSGYLQGHAVPHGYHLFLPADVYIAGTEDALRFAGIENPDLSLISDTRLHFGHLAATDGDVEKGRPMGDLVEDWNYPYWKLAYQVTFLYDGVEYMFTPTLFDQDVAFECEPGSIYDCVPEPNDYAP
jgi:hypothetical protein